MSKWHDITDQEDVSLSEDGTELQVCFDSDHDGNIWVAIPIEFVKQAMTPDPPTQDASDKN